MNVSLAPIGWRLAVGFIVLSALAGRDAQAQLSGWFQSVPGTSAVYTYHTGTYQTEMLPVDISVNFSGDNPTSMLTATILSPIIGARSDGTPIYPIASSFPMRVTATSQDGHDFHGSFPGTQYLFDWRFEPAEGGQLVLNGSVYWAGGRIEVTTIDHAPFEPALAGDYNQDGTVDAADYLRWRESVGTVDTLPNDPTGGTIGPAQYAHWRAAFGQSIAQAGSTLASGAPEPGLLTLLAPVLGLLTLCARIGRFNRRH
jgi:hypothetical protein